MSNIRWPEIPKDERREVSISDLTASMPDALLASEEPGVLVKILAGKMMELDGKIRNLLIWPQIDALPETVLDILAGDMHIDWYDYDASISVKRTIIKSGVAVHKRLGTLWAVQKVITDYFGAGEVREWTTYGGEPHHFKVVSGNAEMVGVNLDRFVAMMEHVKRKSSWLDSVEIGLSAENTIHVAIAYAEHDRELIRLGHTETGEETDDMGWTKSLALGTDTNTSISASENFIKESTAEAEGGN